MNLNHVCGTVHKLRFSHSGGATESGEPGIYPLGPWLWIPGSPLSRRPGMTPHMIRNSESLSQEDHDG
jgi:hypothetical protein